MPRPWPPPLLPLDHTSPLPPPLLPSLPPLPLAPCRTPLEAESKLLLASHQQAALAEESARSQHALHQARLQEREQQLEELLAAMSDYQQRWEAAMAHVRGAIARQQERLEEVKQRVQSRVAEAGVGGRAGAGPGAAGEGEGRGRRAATDSDDLDQ